MKKTVVFLMSLAMLTASLCSCESKKSSSEKDSSKAETTTAAEESVTEGYEFVFPEAAMDLCRCNPANSKSKEK